MQNSPKNTSSLEKPTGNSEPPSGPIAAQLEELSITDWRLMMSEVARGLSAGTTSPVAANAMANVAGKVFSSYKLQMEYAKALGRTPTIEALMPPPKEVTE